MSLMVITMVSGGVFSIRGRGGKGREGKGIHLVCLRYESRTNAFPAQGEAVTDRVVSFLPSSKVLLSCMNGDGELQ